MLNYIAIQEDRPFGWTEYDDTTTLHPLGIGAAILASLLTLALPRRYALLPLLGLACFVPGAQRIVILGLDFKLLRVVVLAGWIRILARSELRNLRWQSPDTVMLLSGFVTATAYIMLWSSMAAVEYRLGLLFDSLGMYFMARSMIRDWKDVYTWGFTLAALSIIVSIAFLNEKATGRNAFSVFGGVPEITLIREGKLRCQGAFAHAILAGCFWAAMIPYIATLWWRGHGQYRMLAIGGITCSTIIILTCASSTPIASLFMGLLAALFFGLRRHTRLLRYGIVVTLAGLHMIMKAPVWHLVSRIDLVGGSTGWHRYNLIDQTIKRFPEWALIGTKSTAHWGWQLEDVTNGFVREATHGGLLGLILLLLMIVMCFSRVGRLLRLAKGNRAKETVAWALGVALFIHIVSFIAVSYFGQIWLSWYFSLAVIVSLSEAPPPLRIARCTLPTKTITSRSLPPTVNGAT